MSRPSTPCKRPRRREDAETSPGKLKRDEVGELSSEEECQPDNGVVSLAITSMGRLGALKLEVHDSTSVHYVVNNLWLLKNFPGVAIPPGLKVTAGCNGRELDLNTILSECKSDLPIHPGSSHLQIHIHWPAGVPLDAKGFNGKWEWKPRKGEACSKAIIQGQFVWWGGGPLRSGFLVARKLSLVQVDQLSLVQVVPSASCPPQLPSWAEQLTGGVVQGRGKNLSIKWSNGTQWHKHDSSPASFADEQRKAIHASLDEQNKRVRH